MVLLDSPHAPPALQLVAYLALAVLNRTDRLDGEKGGIDDFALIPLKEQIVGNSVLAVSLGKILQGRVPPTWT